LSHTIMCLRSRNGRQFGTCVTKKEKTSLPYLFWHVIFRLYPTFRRPGRFAVDSIHMFLHGLSQLRLKEAAPLSACVGIEAAGEDVSGERRGQLSAMANAQHGTSNIHHLIPRIDTPLPAMAVISNPGSFVCAVLKYMLAMMMRYWSPSIP